MIVRTWSGRVPASHAAAFLAHLLATGVAEYRTHPGCREVRVWRRDADGWAHFTLVSTWTDMAAIHAYAGDTPEVAVLYPGDARFALIPDRHVTHHALVASEPAVAG